MTAVDIITECERALGDIQANAKAAAVIAGTYPNGSADESRALGRAAALAWAARRLRRALESSS